MYPNILKLFNPKLLIITISFIFQSAYMKYVVLYGWTLNRPIYLAQFGMRCQVVSCSWCKWCYT